MIFFSAILELNLWSDDVPKSALYDGHVISIINVLTMQVRKNSLGSSPRCNGRHCRTAARVVLMSLVSWGKNDKKKTIVTSLHKLVVVQSSSNSCTIGLIDAVKVVLVTNLEKKTTYWRID